MIKQLIILLSALFFIGCDTGGTETAVIPDTPEVHYLPTHIVSEITFDSLSEDLQNLINSNLQAGMDSIFSLPDIPLDTAISDTNQLIGLSRDSLFIYANLGDFSTRESSLRANPTIPIAFDTVALNEQLTQYGFSFRSLDITPTKSEAIVTGEELLLSINQDIKLILHHANEFFTYDYEVKRKKKSTTDASLFTGSVIPENWPSLQ